MRTSSRLRRGKARGQTQAQARPRARARARPSERPRREDLWLLGALFLGLAALYAFELEVDPTVRLKVLGWQPLLARIVLLGALLFPLSTYLWARRAGVLRQERHRLFLIGVIGLLGLVAQGLEAFVPYLIPQALGVGLTTIFFGAEVGLAFNVLAAALVGLSAHDPGLSLVAFVGGMVMLLRARRLERTRELALIGLEVGLVQIVALAGISLASGLEVWSWSWQPFVWAGLNGPISALLLLGVVPLAEFLTQKTSPLGLVELLNTSHPLLERLAERAPGTYHHSLSVARLAAEAARAVGADPLLAQVGGYYHDIGKAADGVDARYFGENQRDGVNPLEELPPSMSKLILVNHVKAGLELGRQHGLKEDVLRFITEHHGTAVMRYFYVKALQAAHAQEGEPPSLEDFRHEGRKPQTRETAILMLADAAESASRTLQDAGKAEEVIGNLIRERLEDGQLDECPLTLAELNRIKTSFCDTLRAMMHSRPQDYPQARVEALKRPIPKGK